MDINLELVEKYLKNKTKNKDSNEDKRCESFICQYDFFCLNNIKICEKIKEFNLININIYSKRKANESTYIRH